MTGDFANLGIDLDIQLHEAYMSPDKFSLKRSSPRHAIIKFSKVEDNERIIKAIRERSSSLTWDLH